jgi:hypothetical protein
MNTKNVATDIEDDLRSEYDLSKLTGRVRGKYYKRATVGTTLVLLEPDVAEAFPNGQAVNKALRALLRVARTHIGPLRATGSLPNKPLRPTSRVKHSTKKARTSRAARG